MTLQKKATVVSTSVAAILTLIKFSIGILSGSVAVLASAVDSILDMLVSIFNYFAISKSEQPANKYFNYGKGKVEALASVIEGTIITISGFFLLYSAIEKYLNGTKSDHVTTSIAVMIISTCITICLVFFLNHVAKKTNSMVIKSDALHYKTDIYSNLAVLGSLVGVWFFQIELIDVVIGSLIAIYIVYSAYELLHDGVLVLLDKALDKETVRAIKEILNNDTDLTGWHDLKTREAGADTFVDVHLVFNCLISLMDAHRISDKIEHQISKIEPNRNWIINIHLDPYDDSVIQASKLGCNLYHRKREQKI